MLNFRNFKRYIFSISSLSYNIFISKIYFCIFLSENNIRFLFFIEITFLYNLLPLLLLFVGIVTIFYLNNYSKK